MANREGGDNWATEEAKREAARLDVSVCDVLAAMLAAEEDEARRRAIVQAQKFMGCRNIRKRMERT